LENSAEAASFFFRVTGLSPSFFYLFLQKPVSSHANMMLEFRVIIGTAFDKAYGEILLFIIFFSSAVCAILSLHVLDYYYYGTRVGEEIMALLSEL
jgi:hypothetical protein